MIWQLVAIGGVQGWDPVCWVKKDARHVIFSGSGIERCNRCS